MSVDGDIYISWALGNDGPHTINWSFFADLYFDDVVIGRWLVDGGMSTNYTHNLNGWSGLKNRVNPEPGVHTLRLVVDPTDLVPETDESDNVYEQEFTWASSESLSPEPTHPMTDVAPYTPSGWAWPIVATSYSGETRKSPLSVSVPTYIRYAILNRGQVDVPDEVRIYVYLYLDDVLVERRFWTGLRAGNRGTRTEWNGLYEVVNVTPGTHTLKIVVDPTDLLLETNEDNNVFEKEFTWGTGPVPP